MSHRMKFFLLLVAGSVVSAAAYLLVQPSPRVEFGDGDKSHTAHSAFFSPDSKTVLSGGRKNTLKLWDAVTGKMIRQFTNKGQKATQEIWNIGFSPDGKHVFSCGQDRALVMWDKDTGQELREFTTVQGKPVENFAISPDGKNCVTSDFSHVLRVWDVTSGKMLKEDTRVGTSQSMFLEFSRTGSTVLLRESIRLTLWNATTLTITSEHDLAGVNVATCGVIFTHDGKGILQCQRNGQMKELDVETGKENRSFDLKTSSVYYITLGTKGDRLLVGCSDGNARLYSFPECKELQSVPGYGRVQLSPDGKTALTFTKNGRMMLWDLEK